MATENPGQTLTLLSSGDMSSHQFTAVQASTTNAIDGCTIFTARGAAPTGVYQDNSTTAEGGRVMFTGITKMAAGDSSAMETAIAPNTRVIASSVGAAVPSTGATAQHFIGISLDALSTGSTGVISVMLTIGSMFST